MLNHLLFLSGDVVFLCFSLFFWGVSACFSSSDDSEDDHSKKNSLNKNNSNENNFDKNNCDENNLNENNLVNNNCSENRLDVNSSANIDLDENGLVKNNANITDSNETLSMDRVDGFSSLRQNSGLADSDSLCSSEKDNIVNVNNTDEKNSIDDIDNINKKENVNEINVRNKKDEVNDIDHLGKKEDVSNTNEKDCIDDINSVGKKDSVGDVDDTGRKDDIDDIDDLIDEKYGTSFSESIQNPFDFEQEEDDEDPFDEIDFGSRFNEDNADDIDQYDSTSDFSSDMDYSPWSESKKEESEEFLEDDSVPNEEKVNRLRRRIEQGDDYLRSHLAIALSMYAFDLISIEKMDKAEECLNEAESILEETVENGNPELYIFFAQIILQRISFFVAQQNRPTLMQDIASGIRKIQKLIQANNSSQMYDFLAAAYRIQADAFEERNIHNSALQFREYSEKIYRQLINDGFFEYRNRWARSLSFIGDSLRQIGDYDRAVVYYRAACDEWSELENDENDHDYFDGSDNETLPLYSDIVNCLFRLFEVLRRIGRPVEALGVLDKAIFRVEKLFMERRFGLLGGLVHLYDAKSDFYYENQQFDLALVFQTKIIRLLEKYTDMTELAFRYRKHSQRVLVEQWKKRHSREDDTKENDSNNDSSHSESTELTESDSDDSESKNKEQNCLESTDEDSLPSALDSDSKTSDLDSDSNSNILNSKTDSALAGCEDVDTVIDDDNAADNVNDDNDDDVKDVVDIDDIDYIDVEDIFDVIDDPNNSINQEDLAVFEDLLDSLFLSSLKTDSGADDADDSEDMFSEYTAEEQRELQFMPKMEEFLSWQGGAYRKKSVLYSIMGKTEDALTSILQARPFFDRLTEEFSEDMRSTISLLEINQSLVLCDLGRTEEALKLREDGIRLLEELIQEGDDGYETSLAQTLADHAQFLDRLGKHDEAAQVLDRSLKYWTDIVFEQGVIEWKSSLALTFARRAQRNFSVEHNLDKALNDIVRSRNLFDELLEECKLTSSLVSDFLSVVKMETEIYDGLEQPLKVINNLKNVASFLMEKTESGNWELLSDLRFVSVLLFLHLNKNGFHRQLQLISDRFFYWLKNLQNDYQKKQNIQQSPIDFRQKLNLEDRSENGLESFQKEDEQKADGQKENEKEKYSDAFEIKDSLEKKQKMFDQENSSENPFSDSFLPISEESKADGSVQKMSAFCEEIEHFFAEIWSCRAFALFNLDETEAVMKDYERCLLCYCRLLNEGNFSLLSDILAQFKNRFRCFCLMNKTEQGLAEWDAFLRYFKRLLDRYPNARPLQEAICDFYRSKVLMLMEIEQPEQIKMTFQSWLDFCQGFYPFEDILQIRQRIFPIFVLWGSYLLEEEQFKTARLYMEKAFSLAHTIPEEKMDSVLFSLLGALCFNLANCYSPDNRGNFLSEFSNSETNSECGMASENSSGQESVLNVFNVDSDIFNVDPDFLLTVPLAERERFYLEQSDYYYKLSFRFSCENQDRCDQADALLRLGHLEARNGNLEKALEHYQEVLAIYLSLEGDPDFRRDEEIINVYCVISRLFSDDQQNPEARTAFFSSLDTAYQRTLELLRRPEVSDSALYPCIYVWHTLSNAYSQKDQYEKVLEIFRHLPLLEERIDVSKDLGIIISLLEMKRNFAWVYLKYGETEASKNILLEIKERLNSLQNMPETRTSDKDLKLFDMTVDSLLIYAADVALDFDAGIAISDRYLQERKAVFSGINSERTVLHLYIMLNGAVCQADKNATVQALETFQMILPYVTEKFFSEDEASFKSNLLDNIAEAQMNLGRLSDALENSMLSVQCAERIPSGAALEESRELMLSRSLQTRGKIYMKSGCFSDAKKDFEQALNLLENIYRQGASFLSNQIAEVLYFRACYYKGQREFSCALSDALRSAELYRERLKRGQRQYQKKYEDVCRLVIWLKQNPA